MSDIQPSVTPAPTVNPALQPTPTSIPVDQNPCVHIVQSGDTLYSIARDNEVELNDLVAANPAIFGGNPEVMLQIGWELQLPGCGTVEPTAQPTSQTLTPGAETGGAETQPTAASGTVTHVVQAGEGIYSIARQYGVDPQVIIDANNLTNPNLIHPGDTLIIPLGE
jgi:LysM repeat protein